MKLIGATIIIISSIIIGLQLSNSLKDKVTVCDELLQFCSIISMDMSYATSSVVSLIEKSNIPYLSKECLNDDFKLNSPLTINENERLSEFLFALGKSDIVSQQKNLKCFEEYLITIKNKYENQFMKKSKVYLALSICSGLVVSLVLI